MNFYCFVLFNKQIMGQVYKTFRKSIFSCLNLRASSTYFFFEYILLKLTKETKDQILERAQSLQKPLRNTVRRLKRNNNKKISAPCSLYMFFFCLETGLTIKTMAKLICLLQFELRQ